MAPSSLMGLCRFFYGTVTHTAGSFYAHFAEMKTKAIFSKPESCLERKLLLQQIFQKGQISSSLVQSKTSINLPPNAFQSECLSKYDVCLFVVHDFYTFLGFVHGEHALFCSKQNIQLDQCVWKQPIFLLQHFLNSAGGLLNRHLHTL